MTQRIRLPGKNTLELNRLTGSKGEVFYDFNSRTLRLYDGATKGGSVIGPSKAVIAPYSTNSTPNWTTLTFTEPGQVIKVSTGVIANWAGQYPLLSLAVAPLAGVDSWDLEGAWIDYGGNTISVTKSAFPKANFCMGQSLLEFCYAGNEIIEGSTVGHISVFGYANSEYH